MSNPYVLLCGTCTSSTGFTSDTYAHVTTSAQKEAAGPWKRSCRRRCKRQKISPKSKRTRRRKYRLRASILPRLGHGLGHPGVREMGMSPKVAKRQEKAPLSNRKAVLLWLRGLDLNQRPTGYELPPVSPSAAAQCFPGLFRLKWHKTRSQPSPLRGGFAGNGSRFGVIPPRRILPRQGPVHNASSARYNREKS